MPLLRARPKIRLRAPKEIVPGVPFELEARLETRREVEIEWCDLRVEAFEWIALGDASRKLVLMDPLVARLCEARRLPAGVTPLACRAEIPAGGGVFGPSFVGTGNRTVYEAHVHASVAWWPDARASFVLNVVLPPSAPAEGSPRVTSSRADGPSEGLPYLEVSVASDVVEPGGVVEGALSMRGGRGARFAIVAVVVYETADGSGPTKGTAYEVRVELPDVPDGSAVPFALRLPPEVIPTFAARTFRIAYWLEVDVRGSFQSVAVASLPLTVVPRGGAKPASRLVPPHVGDARLTALFELIGRARGHTLEPGPALVLRRNGIEARIERSLRPDGTHLVLSATYPSLNIGLHAYEGGLVRRIVSSRVSTGETAFDAEHVVHGRETAQVARWMQPIAPLLSGLSNLRMRDETLTVSARTSANDRRSIERFVERAEGILDALIAPPPMPAAFVDVVDEWVALARWLGGELEPGHARVTGTCGSARVEVATHYEGDAPTSTSIEVTPELPTSAELSVEAPGDVRALSGVRPEALTLLERLARAGAVAVRPRSTRITIASALAGAVSPKDVRPIVETVMRLHEALKPTRGPFR